MTTKAVKAVQPSQKTTRSLQIRPKEECKL